MCRKFVLISISVWLLFIPLSLRVNIYQSESESGVQCSLCTSLRQEYMGQTSTLNGSPALLLMVPNTSHRNVMKPSQHSTSVCCSSSRRVKSLCRRRERERLSRYTHQHTHTHRHRCLTFNFPASTLGFLVFLGLTVSQPPIKSAGHLFDT